MFIGLLLSITVFMVKISERELTPFRAFSIQIVWDNGGGIYEKDHSSPLLGIVLFTFVSEKVNVMNNVIAVVIVIFGGGQTVNVGQDYDFPKGFIVVDVRAKGTKVALIIHED